MKSENDPEVAYLEIGVRRWGHGLTDETLWKFYGPDLSDTYGGLQGIGGLEAVWNEATGELWHTITDSVGDLVSHMRWDGSSYTHTAITTEVTSYGPSNTEAAASSAWATTNSTKLIDVTFWRGYRIDPTGLYWMGARHYDPQGGRFISPDPLGHAASEDLYSYANGDPVNYVDPTGLDGQRAGPATVAPTTASGLSPDHEGYWTHDEKGAIYVLPPFHVYTNRWTQADERAYQQNLAYLEERKRWKRDHPSLAEIEERIARKRVEGVVIPDPRLHPHHFRNIQNNRALAGADRGVGLVTIPVYFTGGGTIAAPLQLLARGGLRSSITTGARYLLTQATRNTATNIPTNPHVVNASLHVIRQTARGPMVTTLARIGYDDALYATGQIGLRASDAMMRSAVTAYEATITYSGLWYTGTGSLGFVTGLLSDDPMWSPTDHVLLKTYDFFNALGSAVSGLASMKGSGEDQ